MPSAILDNCYLQVPIAAHFCIRGILIPEDLPHYILFCPLYTEPGKKIIEIILKGLVYGGKIFSPSFQSGFVCLDGCDQMAGSGVLQHQSKQKWAEKVQEGGAQTLCHQCWLTVDADQWQMPVSDGWPLLWGALPVYPLRPIQMGQNSRLRLLLQVSLGFPRCIFVPDLPSPGAAQDCYAGEAIWMDLPV